MAHFLKVSLFEVEPEFDVVDPVEVERGDGVDDEGGGDVRLTFNENNNELTAKVVSLSIFNRTICRPFPLCVCIVSATKHTFADHEHNYTRDTAETTERAVNRVSCFRHILSKDQMSIDAPTREWMDGAWRWPKREEHSEYRLIEHQLTIRHLIRPSLQVPTQGLLLLFSLWSGQWSCTV